MFEYRRIEVERGAWPKLAKRVGEARESLEASVGTWYGLFCGAGQIGWSSQEGAVLTRFPEDAQPEAVDRALACLGSVRTSSVERLRLLAEGGQPGPAGEPGVYAHRRFEIAPKDTDEFVELSRAAWPDFEGSFEARIVGLFAPIEATGPETPLLLLTRYASLAVWERSRRAEAPREQSAHDKFRRRHELVVRTHVVTTQVLDGS